MKISDQELQESIIHCREKIEELTGIGCEECKQDHQKLLSALEELRARRKGDPTWNQ